MRIRSCFAAVLAMAVLGTPAVGKAEAEGPVSTPLVAAHVDIVSDLPFYFRVYRGRLPPAQRATYRGSSAMLYGMKGALEIEIEGTAAQPLAEGAGVFIPAGQVATIRAAASEPTDLLLFVLSALPNQRPPLDRPAVTKELYRTPVSLPGLKPGPYEFSLARLTFPAGMPADPPHYRTGAALNYILAGSGSLIADGKTEAMPAGTTQAALAGWFHQWANPGDTPLVILQAQITQEGAAPVVPEPAK